MKKPIPATAGFTLVEMAIVLLIVALAIGGGLSVFSTQMEVQKVKETQSALDEAREALIGYAVTHLATDSRPYLPCPDKTTAAGAGTANDGQEDRTGTGCVAYDGNLPWVTLGLKGLDGWSNRLRYRVTGAPSEAAFARSDTGMKLDAAGALTINSAAAAAVATVVPLVVLSHGPNGLGAISSGGTAVGAPTRANELENADSDAIFISNGPIEIAGSEFDDVVTWLPAGLLFSRLLQAGVCVKTTACP
jgi:prepilin-type N-terminal cleavage/methylation domain-containing protein